MHIINVPMPYTNGAIYHKFSFIITPKNPNKHKIPFTHNNHLIFILDFMQNPQEINAKPKNEPYPK